jgi:branched-subunit amino acid ABC-type transport system permease component
MDKVVNISFKIVSVIRLLGIPMIFILDKLWRNSIADDGQFTNWDLHIQLHWWEYLIVFGTMIIFSINTVVGLLLSFAMTRILRWRQHKNWLVVFYVAELIILPGLIYLCYTRVNEIFFPPEPTPLDQALHFFLPMEASGVSIYEKLQIINYCVLTFCSLFFVASFWRMYKSNLAHKTVSAYS